MIQARTASSHTPQVSQPHDASVVTRRVQEASHGRLGKVPDNSIHHDRAHASADHRSLRRGLCPRTTDATPRPAHSAAARFVAAIQGRCATSGHGARRKPVRGRRLSGLGSLLRCRSRSRSHLPLVEIRAHHTPQWAGAVHQPQPQQGRDASALVVRVVLGAPPPVLFPARCGHLSQREDEQGRTGGAPHEAALTTSGDTRHVARHTHPHVHATMRESTHPAPATN